LALKKALLRRQYNKLLGVIMSCNCSKYSDICYALPCERGFTKLFHRIDIDKHYWRQLFQCPSCNQCWAVEFDNVMNKFRRRAFKINDAENWKSFDYHLASNMHKIEEKGGLSDKECMLMGCKENALLDCYFCATHMP
jgi:hypothetical protein